MRPVLATGVRLSSYLQQKKRSSSSSSRPNCSHFCAIMAPFGKGTFVRFRAILIAKDFDRRLIERTVTMAQQKGGFSAQHLRATLDSSPLWGAARVEDTYNLLGHTLRKALDIIAHDQGRDLTEVVTEAGAPWVADSVIHFSKGQRK